MTELLGTWVCKLIVIEIFLCGLLKSETTHIEIILIILLFISLFEPLNIFTVIITLLIIVIVIIILVLRLWLEWSFNYFKWINSIEFIYIYSS